MSFTTTTILIVEDSQTQAMDLANKVREITNGNRWEVICTPTLEEALRLQHQCDVIILDLTLEDSTAAETVAAIPQFERPVIVHTSSNDRQTLERLAAVGCSNVLYKPLGESQPGVSPAELRQRILFSQRIWKLTQAVGRLREAVS